MDGHPDIPAGIEHRWHPRITPFRLAFVLITTTVGIVKAVLVSMDDSMGSTTVEWIGGVVLALSFQFLGDIESFEHQNTFARFIFSHDCLAPLWEVIARPPYTDNEAPHSSPYTGTEFLDGDDVRHRDVAIVTLYRLLVSFTTLAFGSAKMVCLYTGRSGAMSTLDWALSVPIVLLLYCVGLYENNTVHLARQFFEAECSTVLREVTWWAIYIALLLSSLLLSFTCLQVGQEWIYFSMKSIAASPEYTSKGATCTIFSRIFDIYDICGTIFIASLGLGFPWIGSLPLAIICMSLLSWDRAHRAARGMTTGVQPLLKLREVSIISKIAYRIAPPISKLAFHIFCLVVCLGIYTIMTSVCVWYFGKVFEAFGPSRQKVLHWVC